jgi:hypothetical protein
MRLRPRHYLLFALIAGLFAFNLWRRHRVKPLATPTPVHVAPTAPPAQTPAWLAFDHAASLRDAPDTQFQPALTALHQQMAASPAADLTGCLTWLEFYRQGALHPAKDPQWQERSTRHLDSCSKYHADTTL